MYCPRCGIYNPKEDPSCRICALDLVGAKPQPQEAIDIDLARLPYVALVKPLMATNLLLALIAFPIISVRYAIARLTGKPFLSKIMRSKASRMKVVELETFPRLNRDEFYTANSQLVSDGFKKVADFEDTSTAQTTLQRLLVNKVRKFYALVHVNAVTGRIAHVQVFALTAKGGYISVDNTHGIPIRTRPPGVADMHIPGASTGEIYEWLVRHVAKLGEQTILLDPPKLMPFLEHVRRALIDAGIRERVLQPETDSDKTRPGGGLTLCAHHPLRQAVRQCDTCGTALCEECYTESEGQTLCADCLAAAGSHGTGPGTLELPEGFCYAGFAYRTAAGAVDMLLLAAVMALAFYAVYGPLSLVSPTTGRAAAIIALMPLAFVAVVYNFGYLVRTRGRSIGQRVWGLYVTDSAGRKPDPISVGVRLAFKLVSVLFVLPLLANAVVLFGKRRRALHDRLADTYVVGKRSSGKAIAAWAVSIVALCALFAVPVSAVFMLKTLFGPGPKVNEALQASWEYRFDKELFAFGAVVPRGERVVVTAQDSIRGLDARTGAALWTLPKEPDEWVSVAQYDTTQPFLLRREPADGGAAVRLIDVDRGVVAWEQTVSGAGARFVAGDGMVVAFGNDTIVAFGPNGRRLWARSVAADTGARVSADINDGVLITRSTGGAACALELLDMGTGKPIWTQQQSRLRPLRTLVDGYHLFLNESGSLALMALRSERVYWELGSDMGHVVGQRITRTSRYGPPQGFLYCAKGVVDTRTGRQVVLLPDGVELACAGREHLVTIEKGGEPNDTLAAFGGPITLLDRKTGSELLTIGSGRYLAVRLAGEDDERLYLCANSVAGSGLGGGTATTLFTVDKQRNEAVPLEIGTNINPALIRVLPRENLVVVPTHRSVAAYPLQAENPG